MFLLLSTSSPCAKGRGAPRVALGSAQTRSILFTRAIWWDGDDAGVKWGVSGGVRATKGWGDAGGSGTKRGPGAVKKQGWMSRSSLKDRG